MFVYKLMNLAVIVILASSIVMKKNRVANNEFYSTVDESNIEDTYEEYYKQELAGKWFCTNCGRENEGQTSFCGYCGNSKI